MARAGITLTINALSGLIFIFTLLLVLGYYFVTNRAKNPLRTGVPK
jgi:spermidine/putrescine transport system permease protein